jgi:hypothetical protein
MHFQMPDALSVTRLWEQTTRYNVVACSAHALWGFNCPILERYYRSRRQRQLARWTGVVGFHDKSRIRLKVSRRCGPTREAWLRFALLSKWRLKSFNQQKNGVYHRAD